MRFKVLYVFLRRRRRSRFRRLHSLRSWRRSLCSRFWFSRTMLQKSRATVASAMSTLPKPSMLNENANTHTTNKQKETGKNKTKVVAVLFFFSNDCVRFAAQTQATMCNSNSQNFKKYCSCVTLHYITSDCRAHSRGSACLQQWVDLSNWDGAVICNRAHDSALTGSSHRRLPRLELGVMLGFAQVSTAPRE